MDTNTLSTELYTVNAERHALRCQVAELEAECARLGAELYARGAWQVQAEAMRRTQLRMLGLALDAKDAANDYLAFPKFLARQAATAVKALWASAGTRPDLGPSVKFEAPSL